MKSEVKENTTCCHWLSTAKVDPGKVSSLVRSEWSEFSQLKMPMINICNNNDGTDSELKAKLKMEIIFWIQLSCTTNRSFTFRENQIKVKLMTKQVKRKMG